MQRGFYEQGIILNESSSFASYVASSSTPSNIAFFTVQLFVSFETSTFQSTLVFGLPARSRHTDIVLNRVCEQGRSKPGCWRSRAWQGILPRHSHHLQPMGPRIQEDGTST